MGRLGRHSLLALEVPVRVKVHSIPESLPKKKKKGCAAYN